MDKSEREIMKAMGEMMTLIWIPIFSILITVALIGSSYAGARWAIRAWEKERKKTEKKKAHKGKSWGQLLQEQMGIGK